MRRLLLVLIVVFLLSCCVSASNLVFTLPLDNIPPHWHQEGFNDFVVELYEENSKFKLHLRAFNNVGESKFWPLPFQQHLNIKTFAYLEDEILYIFSEQPFSALQHIASYYFDGFTITVLEEWTEDPSQSALENLLALLEQGEIEQAAEQLNYIFYPSAYFDFYYLMVEFLIQGHNVALSYYHNNDPTTAAKTLAAVFDIYLYPITITLDSKKSYIESPMQEYLPLSTFIVILNDYAFFLEQAALYEEATAVLKDVLNLEPTRLVAHLNLADSLWGQNFYHQASEYYQMYTQKMKQRNLSERIPEYVEIRIEKIRSIIALKEQEHPIYIQDPILEAIVRQALDKPYFPIYQDEALSLENLILNCYLINSLQGLEYFQSLQKLLIYADDITDLEPLKHLTALEQLEIASYQITSIEPLKYLENLKVLDLYYNQVADLTPLQNLSKLESLYFSSSQKVDYTPLGQLTNLKELRIPYVELEDYSFLNSLTNLEVLYLGSYPLKDLSIFSHLINLVELILPYHESSDLDALKPLENLEYLFLGHYYPIDNIQSIANFDKLKVLGLVLTDGNDLSLLQGLTLLEEIFIGNSHISDLSPLAALIELKVLYLYFNEITDITPLTNLTNLEYLDLRGNNISDLSPISNLIKLKELNLAHNQITDISPLLRNPHFGINTYIYLDSNPLDKNQAIFLKQIAELEKRGSVIYY